MGESREGEIDITYCETKKQRLDVKMQECNVQDLKNLKQRDYNSGERREEREK